jgi:hypothetical protein
MNSMARKLAPGNKKAKQPPPKNTRSNSAGHKRPAVVPIDNLADSSSDEEGVNRPKKDKVYTMSKKEFVEQMTLLNHPILKAAASSNWRRPLLIGGGLF